MLTKRAYSDLFRDNPRVNRVIGVTGQESLRAVAASLRAERYTHLLDLHKTVRSHGLRLLVPGNWSSYRKRVVPRALLIRTKRNYYADDRPVAERYFEAARALEVQPDGRPPEFFLNSEEQRKAEQWLAHKSLGGNRRLIALAPGAAHATKRWPTDSWIALVGRLAAAGKDIVVVGGSADQELCAAVARAGGSAAAVAAGEFGLQGTGGLISRAEALISGDTGVMHMATALGTPVLALFGPTVKEFGFFPYRARAAVLERSLPCRPCSSMGTERCPLGHHRCLVDIEPNEVETALRRLLT